MDQRMMELPSLPHGNPVEMQFRLTFHSVNNVSLTIKVASRPPEIGLTAALSPDEMCSSQTRLGFFFSAFLLHHQTTPPPPAQSLIVNFDQKPAIDSK